MAEYLIAKINYWVYVGLLVMGLYAMMGKRNLMKKLIGLNIFQTAIILYFVSAGVKEGATLPIVWEGASPAAPYMNPLPHALMLTAIVVMVSTTGVALAILLMVHRRYQTLEEDEIQKRLPWKTPPSSP